MRTTLRQLGCTDEQYEQVKNHVLEEQRTKPFRSKLKSWLFALFLAAIAFFLFIMWKLDSF